MIPNTGFELSMGVCNVDKHTERIRSNNGIRPSKVTPLRRFPPRKVSRGIWGGRKPADLGNCGVSHPWLFPRWLQPVKPYHANENITTNSVKSIGYVDENYGLLR